VEFKDVYRAEAIGKSKKSLTVTLEFRSPEKTLTDTEVNAQVEKIMHKLSQALGASIR
jgi:phenylalanyl-tRNA synthetase beta chain